MEEIWREARWIMDALQFARYKQSTGGVSLAWVIDFNNDGVPDKPVSTSSQLDYLPSPAPSPEPCRKHPGELRVPAGYQQRTSRVPAGYRQRTGREPAG
jgi:hypothetical protein